MENTRVGVIGFGSMGSMLAEGFLRTGALEEECLSLYTRTQARLETISRDFPGVDIRLDASSLVSVSDIILLCVPPSQIIAVLAGLSKTDFSGKLVVSIAGSVSIDMIERFIQAKIIRMVPNITAEADEGVFVFSTNSLCARSDFDQLHRLFTPLGTLLEVPEDKIEAYTDITSCSPGIFSAVFQEFIESSARIGGLPKDLSTQAFIRTLYGLAKLLKENNQDFETVMRRVARKGGTTEIGIEIVQDRLPDVFDRIFTDTLAKQARRKSEIGHSIDEALGAKTQA